MRRIGLAVVGLAVLAGCGAPATNADPQEFCDVLESTNALDFAGNEIVPERDWPEYTKRFADAAQRRAEIGTPDGVDEEVRKALLDSIKAFELYADATSQRAAEKGVEDVFGKPFRTVNEPLRLYRRNECPYL